MAFSFRPAVREQTSLLIAMAGASGAGKTMSALRLASGLAGSEGKIAFVDTEAGRALHYADQFAFDHGDLMPPFRPQAFLEAIEAAQAAEYDVIVIDSFSHEYDGEGGIIDMADEKLRQNPNMKSPQHWAEPKQAHKRMVSKLLQTRAHLIFCLRAEEKISIQKDPNNPKKTVVVPSGWHPICEKRFMYEMTASLLFKPGNPGVPEAIKIQDQHKPMLMPDGPIDEACGEALREWANGGASRQQRDLEAYDQAVTEARKGAEAFRAWWRKATKAQRDHLKPYIDELRDTAAAADNAHAGEPAPAAQEGDGLPLGDGAATQDPGAPYTLTTLDLNQHQYDSGARFADDAIAALRAAPDSDQAADLWQANQEEVQRLQQHAQDKAHAIWQAYQATQPAEENAEG